MADTFSLSAPALTTNVARVSSLKISLARGMGTGNRLGTGKSESDGKEINSQVFLYASQGRIQQFLKRGVVHYWRNLHHQWWGRRVTAAPFLWRDLLRGSGAMPPSPPKKCFRFFLLKRHFQHSWDLKSVVKACYKNWSLFYFSTRNPKIIMND